MFLLVVCQCFWLVSISSIVFRKIEPWEGPICHLAPVSGKMEIIGQALAFLFSIIKGVGRVGPTTRAAQPHFQQQLRPKAGQYDSAIDPRLCISTIDPA